MNKTVKMIIAGVLIAAVLFLSYSFSPMGKQTAIAGIPDPIQKEAKGQTEMTINGYNLTIKYKFSYEIEALVVHTKNYSGSDLDDKLAPRDFALAWGPAAEMNTEVDFHWSQSNRWYHWSMSNEDASKISADDVNTHSANTHIIPADDNVKKLVKKVKTGDHIKMTGYLVNITGENDNGNSFYWNSSESREDTGDGACEVFYVTSIEWIE